MALQDLDSVEWIIKFGLIFVVVVIVVVLMEQTLAFRKYFFLVSFQFFALIV